MLACIYTKKKIHLKACLNWYYDLQPKPRYLSAKGQPKRYHPKLFESPTKPTLTLTIVDPTELEVIYDSWLATLHYGKTTAAYYVFDS